MTTRTITGHIVLPNGEPIGPSSLTVTALEPLPADPAFGIPLSAVFEPIINGTFSIAVVAPAHYRFVVHDGQKVVLKFDAGVAESDEPATLEELYTSRASTLTVSPTISEQIAAAIAAHVAENDPHSQYLEPGEGGSGDMVRAVYDPDHDGKVTSCETADAAPWSGIAGKPDTFPPDAHVHDDRYFTEAEVTERLSAKIDASERGTANGVATLGADGKIPSNQIPAIAISDTFVVGSEPAMLSLAAAEIGDVCVRADLGKCFILAGEDPEEINNWQELLTPASPVQSVNGKTGAVTLTATDVGAASFPVGFIGEFSGSVEPAGWAFCNGQALSRSTDSALFAVIGTSYGTGNGSTTFNVPDFRNRVPLGANTGDHALGQSGGNNSITPSVNVTLNSFQTQPEITGGELAVAHTGPTLSGSAQDNRSAYVAVHFIIKR